MNNLKNSKVLISKNKKKVDNKLFSKFKKKSISFCNEQYKKFRQFYDDFILNYNENSKELQPIFEINKIIPILFQIKQKIEKSKRKK